MSIVGVVAMISPGIGSPPWRHRRQRHALGAARRRDRATMVTSIPRPARRQNFLLIALAGPCKVPRAQPYRGPKGQPGWGSCHITRKTQNKSEKRRPSEHALGVLLAVAALESGQSGRWHRSGRPTLGRKTMRKWSGAGPIKARALHDQHLFFGQQFIGKLLVILNGVELGVQASGTYRAPPWA